MSKYLNTTHRKVSWFNKVFQSGELKMKPPFQRNPVWTNKQKGYLIDTILRGYPIPELYMQEIVDAKGETEFIVVDGQQRIRACLDFINGKHGVFSESDSDWKDFKFDDLTDTQKQRFYQYDFVVRVLPELSEPEIREIFTRLNKNTVSLNNQELRQATYWGEFISSMNEISNYEDWTTLGIFTANDIRRMLDVEIISEIAIAMLHGFQNKKQTIDKYYQLYEEEFEDKSKVKNGFLKVLSEIVQLFPDFKSTRWKKKTDFYSLFLLFSKHINKLPLSQDKRDRIREILIEFSERINSYTKTTEEEGIEYTSEEKKYGDAIRAGTDLGNRKRRGEVLEKITEEIWK